MKQKKQFTSIERGFDDIFNRTEAGMKCHYELIYSNEKAFLFKRCYDSQVEYEVFKATVREKRIFSNGWQSVEGVGVMSYPSNESFGSWAWNYCGEDGYERAVEKFKQISA